MNQLHRWYCRSSRWQQKLTTEILPWTLKGIDLGDRVLEVGPGSGLTTEWLRRRCRSLACLEVDFDLARSLARRACKTNVSVQCGDATAMPYREQAFSSAVALTMLHHVPSTALQDSLFREVCRVLKPSGVFVGSDSLPSWLMRVFHVCDTMIMVQPATLQARLESAGFSDIKIEIGTGRFRFFARRPSGAQP